MRSLWKGSISFGLVSLPVALFPATRREEIRFSMLRRSDLSPINFKRVAAVDGKEVKWEEIVKGYEYEKGKFVVLKDEDFKRVDVEATQRIDIVDFVKLEEIDFVYFYKPYYLEPQKGGEKAYTLLRETLENSGKVGIAKVVIKARQYLASLKTFRHALVLELMHFGDEVLNHEDLKIPKEIKSPKRELEMAKLLVENMTEKWDPSRYTDEYRSALLKLIDEKIKKGSDFTPPASHEKKSSPKIVDLAEILEQSLKATKPSGKKSTSHHHLVSKKRPWAKSLS